MSTIAQLKAQRDAIVAQAPKEPTSDSRFAWQQYRIKQAEYEKRLSVANARLAVAQASARPLSARTDAQIESEFGKLIGLGAAATVDGGRVTAQSAKRSNAVFQAAGGDVRLRALAMEMKKRGIYDIWMREHQSESLWVSTFRPMLKAGLIAGAVIYGVGALSTSASIGGATSAAVPAAVPGVATATNITVAGVGTGYSTGIAALDTVIGAAGTGAVSGAVTSGVSGGSVMGGAKAGAAQGATSGVVGEAGALVPSVPLNLPKIELPGSSGGSIVDDIVKSALKGAPVLSIGMPKESSVASSGSIKTSGQVTGGIDWKKIAGIVAGVAGLISIISVR